MTAHRTRLAPSPTGALHLGNARTFLVNWALARQRDWHIVLRMEDLDSPRVKAWAADEAIDVLQWMGLDWDSGPTYQLANQQPYEQALAQLARQGDIYACRCTRREIEAASLSAPHNKGHERQYPGTCRPAEPKPVDIAEFTEPGLAWRLRVPAGNCQFTDEFAGPQQFDVASVVGDFLIRTKAGLPSYQLAVVVDDARQQVDQVVRGDDLLSSTARQLLLYDRLKLGQAPTYTHLPLVLGEDGRRLAKRHGDSRLSMYRQHGVAPERMVGLLGHWCGLGPLQEMSAADFLDAFLLEKMPKEPIVFTKTEHAWLLAR